MCFLSNYRSITVPCLCLLSNYRSITVPLCPITVPLPFHYQVLGTKYLVPGTWYQVLGTKYFLLIIIIFPFLISPFDQVQTTLFKDLSFWCVIGSAENDRSHAEISFRIFWWGSWVLVTSEVARHLNDDSGHLGIPRTFAG